MSYKGEAMLVLAKYRIVGVVGCWNCRVDGVWRSRIIVLVAAPWLGLWTRLARDLGAKPAAGNYREQELPLTSLEGKATP